MDITKKIHNYLFVSDKIITYKVAAALLDVDVNEAKRIVADYITNIKDKKENIHVSYVVGGILENKHKVVLVSEDKYDRTKSKFSLVTIDHVYSIQKSPIFDWAPISNVDDFIYNEKNVEVKTEVKDIKQTSKDPYKSKESVVDNKKGSISSFFSQQSKNQNKSPKTSVKIETNKNGNTKKSGSIMSSFVNKTHNKENISKALNNAEAKVEEKTVKQEVDSDEEEIITQSKKKRTRIINDDDEDDDGPLNKCQKIDILDDPMETENGSDVDIFGSPEKAEVVSEKEDNTENMEELVSSGICETESTTQTEETESTTQTEDTESTTQTEETESEIMYQDDDGYFVTEKKKSNVKKHIEEPKAKITKKEITEKKKVEKEVKKDIAKKLKTNTNQKTLFNFFKKQ